ncbi:MAG: 50S ribosomal protein L18 [archaeon]
MASKATYIVKFRRRLAERTNYAKRLALLKSGKPRLVVRKSNMHVLAQVIEFDRKGDKTIASAVSGELKKFGWKNGSHSIPAAYLTGLLCGKRAQAKGAKEAVFDLGLVTPVHGSRSFAALKGAIDSGLNVKADESAFPGNDRISGKHISLFGEKNGNDSLKGIIAAFEETKKRVLAEGEGK